ncbi:sigma factor-like helix-turn-helix DNA-binding protein [Streptomyces sp. NPDC018019]|uniref:sigma factor-like helix-turn-helix DNA-binding protein n=1 Tax=Streptomyces sp. NPDC018019 TaxID=3365030 RepID=UPI0037B2D06E
MTETERTEVPVTSHAAPDAPSESAPSPTPDAQSAERPCPAAAFDALYTRHASDLTRQAIVLTGHSHLSREAVERSFQMAWQRWPEVAVDPDPAGRVRAMVHEYALSPWHRMRPGLWTAERPSPEAPAPPCATPPERALREAVLRLPAPYRRVLLLHDGLGLELSETAAEVEASTPATAGRLVRARQALAEQIPELGLASETPVRQREILRERLAGLARTQPVAPPTARAVRSGSERTVSRMTQGAFGLTALIAVATTFTLVQQAGTLPGRPEAGHPAAASSVTPGPDRTEKDKATRAPQAKAGGPARGKVVRAGHLAPEAR